MKEGNPVQHLQHPADGVVNLFVRQHRQDIAGKAAPAEGHQHPAADRGLVCAPRPGRIVGEVIGQRLVKGGGYRHFNSYHVPTGCV